MFVETVLLVIWSNTDVHWKHVLLMVEVVMMLFTTTQQEVFLIVLIHWRITVYADDTTLLVAFSQLTWWEVIQNWANPVLNGVICLPPAINQRCFSASWRSAWRCVDVHPVKTASWMFCHDSNQNTFRPKYIFLVPSSCQPPERQPDVIQEARCLPGV